MLKIDVELSEIEGIMGGTAERFWKKEIIPWNEGKGDIPNIFQGWVRGSRLRAFFQKALSSVKGVFLNSVGRGDSLHGLKLAFH